MNDKHADIIRRIYNNSLGSSDAAKVIFKGRYFDDKTKGLLVDALINRRDWAQENVDRFTKNNDPQMSEAWLKIVAEWNVALENLGVLPIRKFLAFEVDDDNDVNIIYYIEATSIQEAREKYKANHDNDPNYDEDDIRAIMAELKLEDVTDLKTIK